MAAPAIPVPVPGESGDTEQRAAYADTADPTAATPPSVSREPSLAEAAAALTQQTVCPALTPAAPIPVAGRSDYTEQRAADADADGPIAIAPLSGEREPSLAGEAAVAPTRHTISPALTPARPVAGRGDGAEQRAADAGADDPITAAPPSVERGPPLAEPR